MTGSAPAAAGPESWSAATSSVTAVVTRWSPCTAASMGMASMSAYAARKPPPESPTGSTRTSAPAQPEPIASPASREVSGPIVSEATSTRTVHIVAEG